MGKGRVPPAGPVKAKDRLGFVPYSVLDPLGMPKVRQRERELKAWVGDQGQTRRGSLVKDSDIWGTYTSIFSPVLADAILALWAPPAPAAVIDPFAGGGTRAFIACRLGYDYTGIELRAAEVNRLNAQARRLGVSPIIHQGDACSLVFDLGAEAFDFLMTCPPYYNLERYHGGAADLSMCRTYGQFLQRLRRVLVGTYRILKPGARAVWVVGSFRTGRGKNRLVDFRGDVVAAAQDCGFHLDEIAVIKRKLGSAPRRVGQSLRRKRLVRVHDYAVVLQK